MALLPIPYQLLTVSITLKIHVVPVTLLYIQPLSLSIPAVFPFVSPSGFSAPWDFLPVKPAVSFVVGADLLSSAASLAINVRPLWGCSINVDSIRCASMESLEYPEPLGFGETQHESPS